MPQTSTDLPIRIRRRLDRLTCEDLGYSARNASVTREPSREELAAKALVACETQFAAETGFGLEWLRASSLGHDGLARMVKAVELARELDIDFSHWPLFHTASVVSTVLVFDLQEQFNATRPTPAPAPAVKPAKKRVTPKIVEAAQAVAEASEKFAAQAVVEARTEAQVMQITGTPPVELLTELATADGPHELVDIVAPVEAPKAEITEPSPTPAIPAPKVGGAKVLGTVPLELLRSRSQRPAPKAETIGKPGDRIAGEDGEIHFICSGFVQRGQHRNPCQTRVSLANARVTADRNRVYRAYNVPVGRLIVAQDLDKSEGHVVFCPNCAKHVLRGEGDDRAFSDLLEVAASRTEEALYKRGRVIALTLLKQPSVNGYTRSLLVALALWEPTIEEIYARYEAKILSDRRADAEREADRAKRNNRRGVGTGLSQFSKKVPGRQDLDYDNVVRMDPIRAVEWAMQGVLMNPNPFARKNPIESAPVINEAQNLVGARLRGQSGEGYIVGGFHMPDDEDLIEAAAF